MDNEPIDPELKKVIEELNKVGLKTKYSCQGNHGPGDGSDYAYIFFDTKAIKGFQLLVNPIENSAIIYWNR